MPGFFWTTSEIVEAKRLRSEGKTYKQIAEYFPGRTSSSIAYRLKAEDYDYRSRRKQSLKKVIGAPVKATDPSAVLRDRQLRLIEGFANDNRIAFKQAVNVLLYAGEARG